MSNQPSPQPTVGRIVHYVLAQGRSAGQVRAATIVRVWDDAGGTANLQVHLDGSNDAGAEGPNELYPTPTSVVTSATMVGGTLVDSTSSFVPLTAWVTSVAYDGISDSDGKYRPGTWHYPPRV